MQPPVVVEFPLRGVWISPNTPGSKIPSHGTDSFGERYAYDFVGIDPSRRSTRFYRSSPLRYLTTGVPLRDCFGWGQPIYAASAGTVVQAVDGIPERDPAHPIRDIRILIRNVREFKTNQIKDFRTLSGNHIIIETADGYAVYAHAQTGSIAVSRGDRVVVGQHLANIGHSGNSTAPHLHFQLMDQPDPWIAQGILCCFREYEVLRGGVWQRVQNGIPKATDRIRKL